MPCHLIKRKSRTKFFKKKANIATKAYKDLQIGAHFKERRQKKKAAEGGKIIKNLEVFRATQVNFKEVP